ncbi:MAG: MBL fold metallo-hydrolase [Acidimicrobiia bacterium]|nr:MBL fold metallo-hydrolase [Acidimicrobiia bacterium]
MYKRRTPSIIRAPVPQLSRGLSWVDLSFLGRPHTIATGVIEGAGTLALVDPGPSTCLETLDLQLQGQGLRLSEVTHILLTHIHLDHAGATGTIVRRHPGITVYVHERGAPHMHDPAKLLSSATRLYGEEMDRLWGAFEPVPATNLVPLRGGERLEAGGRRFHVAYTPGHASHHVSYFDADSGVAFVGDTAGVRIDGGYLVAPTPPPDIDIELWTKSAATIEAWSPATLFLTHFGPAQDVRPHLRMLLDNLKTAAGFVRTLLEQPGTDDERRARFAEQFDRELRRTMNDAQVAAYALASPTWILWLGLARYWRARGVGSGSG